MLLLKRDRMREKCPVLVVLAIFNRFASSQCEIFSLVTVEHMGVWNIKIKFHTHWKGKEEKNKHVTDDATKIECMNET